MADYVPTAYSQPIGTTVTAGTARSTGNAYNELVKSEIAKDTFNCFLFNDLFRIISF